MSNKIYYKLKFNNFFNLFLHNYFLNILKLQYKENFISIYLYYLKEDRFSFLYKFLSMKKNTFNSLYFRKSFSFIILKKNKTNLVIKHSFCLLLSLLHKIFVSKLYIFLYKKKYIIISNFSFDFEKNNKKKSNLIQKKKNVKKVYIKNFFKIKLKYINYIIKFKCLAIFAAVLLKIYTNKNYIINFKFSTENIISQINYPFIFKFLKNSASKQKFYIILLSFYFFKSHILNKYLVILIKKTKNKKHTKNLIIFLNYVKILFDKQLIPLTGFKFKIAGRLGGKLRKGCFHFKLGFLKLMFLNNFVDYSCDYVFTQYGSFSLKL
jgi:hypothetical protein